MKTTNRETHPPEIQMTPRPTIPKESERCKLLPTFPEGLSEEEG